MNWLTTMAMVLLLCPLITTAQKESTPSETAAYGYYQEGNEYLQNDNFSQALALAKKGLALSKDNVWCSLLAGEALIGLKQYDNALPYLRSVQGRLPGNRDIYEAFIELEYGKANFEQVKFYTNMALLHFPNDVYFSVVKVDMLDKTLKFPPGDELLQKLFIKHPDDTLLTTAWDEHCKNAAAYYQTVDAQLARDYEEKTGQYPTLNAKKTIPVIAEPTKPLVTEAPKPEPKPNAMPEGSGKTEKKVAPVVATTPKPTVVNTRPEPGPTAGYTQSATDTIQRAKQLRAEGKYKQAADILKIFTRNHPKDVNAIWLYGETELWRGYINRSLKLYRKAAALGPGNDYLLLDYANVLNVAGKIKESRLVLTQVEAKAKKYSSATLTTAQRAFWDGDYNQAEQLTNNVLSTEGYDNTKALALQKEVKLAKSTWLKIAANYTSDNQPVQSVSPQISAGKYINKMFDPQVSVQTSSYTYGQTQSTLYNLQAANNAVLPKAHMTLSAGAGIFGDANGTQQAAIYKLSVQQQVHHFYWQLLAEQKPVVYTPASVDTNVLAQHALAAVGWERGRSFVAKAVAEAYFFDGNNRLDIMYGWFFLPELKLGKVGFRVGYSYSYSNATQNNYRAVLSLDSILKDPSRQIAGTYGRYFTPANQQVQSLLFAISVKTARLDVGVNADYGVAATIDNPYVYLGMDEKGQVQLKKEFSSEQFTPYGLQAHLNWHLSPATEMTLQYSYKHTWFFDVQSADLGFKFNILNEKKSRKK